MGSATIGQPSISDQHVVDPGELYGPPADHDRTARARHQSGQPIRFVGVEGSLRSALPFVPLLAGAPASPRPAMV